MNNYLIPANTKRSMLLFGYFKWFDLFLFLGGIILTLILLTFLPIDKILFAVIALLPVMIAGFLVMPIPNYYNMRTLLITVIGFYTNQRKFRWKGWQYLDGKDK